MKHSPVKLFIGWLILAAAALAVASIGGCTTISARPANRAEPRTLDEVRRESQASEGGTKRLRIALVLGGGGLRGFAHTGVIRALEEAGIEPEIVVGTSAGALVGAAYASGMRASEIESAASSLEVSALLDWTLSKSGIVRGTAIANWVNKLTRDVPIEQFPRRYAAIATDLGREVPLAITRGDAGTAVQASAAVPGVMLPIAYQESLLVDGGITSLVPVRFARAMGADFVIAVDIYCAGPRYGGDGALTVLYRVMQTQSCLVAAPEAAEADILIAPIVKAPGLSSAEEQQRAAREGYEATLAALRNLPPHMGRDSMTTGTKSVSPKADVLPAPRPARDLDGLVLARWITTRRSKLAPEAWCGASDHRL
jgi:NTE family protein